MCIQQSRKTLFATSNWWVAANLVLFNSLSQHFEMIKIVFLTPWPRKEYNVICLRSLFNLTLDSQHNISYKYHTDIRILIRIVIYCTHKWSTADIKIRNLMLMRNPDMGIQITQTCNIFTTSQLGPGAAREKFNEIKSLIWTFHVTQSFFSSDLLMFEVWSQGVGLAGSDLCWEPFLSWCGGLHKFWWR